VDNYFTYTYSTTRKMTTKTATTTTTTLKEETVTVSPEASDVEHDEDDHDTTTKESSKNDDKDVKGTTTNNDEQVDDDDDDDSSDSTTIPHEFVCPLTLEIFQDPLMDRRGMNFERDAIVEWLNRGNLTCPLTREPLGYRSLVPNVNLRARVEQWKREHGYDVTKKEKNHHNHKFIGLIEVPVHSELELQWSRYLIQARAREITRRVEEHQRQEEEEAAGAAAAAGENTPAASSNGRRRRRVLGGGRTGYSPTTQQRRLAGFLGEALNIVRRPPLVTAEES
jgi:U-box domain